MNLSMHGVLYNWNSDLQTRMLIVGSSSIKQLLSYHSSA